MQIKSDIICFAHNSWLWPLMSASVELPLLQISKQRNKSYVDTVIQLVNAGRTRVASFNMHKEDIIAFMQQPWVVTSSLMANTQVYWPENLSPENDNRKAAHKG